MNRDYLLHDIREVLRKDYTVNSIFSGESLTISGGATPSATSSEIVCEKAKQVFVTVNNTGASTDLTAEIFLNYKDSGTFDTTADTTINLGNGEQKTAEINTGFYALKVKLTNNDVSNTTTADVDCRIISDSYDD